MTTTFKSQITPGIGGAPDVGYDFRFTSLNLWNTARKGDLTVSDTIEIAEVFGPGNALTGQLDITNSAGVGWITDATRYIEIRAAAGQQHPGYWSTSKARGSITTNDARAIFINSGTTGKRIDLRITGMQFEVSTNTNNTVDGLQVIYNDNGNGSVYCTIDKCLIRYKTTAADAGLNIPLENTCVWIVGNSGPTIDYTIKNSVLLFTLASQITIGGDPWPNPVVVRGIHNTNGTVTSYNNDVVIRTNGGDGQGTMYIVAVETAAVFISQNCYYAYAGAAVDGTFIYQGVTPGSNDATVNDEAPTYQDVLFTTTNFTNIGADTEDLHIKTGSVLKNNGVTLGSVTYDFVGISRPQGPAFDIGANEYEYPPICWNYTARYHNSNKLFKASGCGSFPKSLRVPGNIDPSTGRMIDDGILINPDEYRVC